MSAAAPIADLSPYARAIGELALLGYHAIPIMPLEKAPGEYKGGQWWRMKEWQRFRDRAPTEFERSLWARNMPAANVGIVLGTPAGKNLRLVAVDVDTTDPDEFDDLISALPYSPMVKRGAKGETRFYRAPAGIKSRSYSATDKRRLIDLLTGNETRQTVVPPSIHTKDGAASGYVYAWLAGPVRADELPLFGEDELERLEDTLRHLGWDPDASRAGPLPVRDPEDGDTIWREANNAALANIEAWVHDLGLFKLRRSGGRYECVGTWRPSSTGRPLEARNPNLKIHPGGIRDFHEDKTYTPIDLVMCASGCGREEATDWLRGKLGLQDPEPILLKPRPKLVEEHFDPETGEVLEEPVPTAQLDELPDELTRVPGLLGELTDWIADTARRPQRGLSLLAACGLVGTAGGRKYAGPTRSGTHLYMLAIARSAAGKDHPRKQVPQVLNACNMANHVGPGQFMSLSALVNRIVRQPLTYSCMDEFGSFMAKMKNKKASSHEAAIPAFMRELWSSSFSSLAPPEWADRSPEQIHSPAFSIYGVTTPGQFYDALGGDDVHNGFLNRFLLVSTRLRPSDREPKINPAEVPEGIRRSMLAIVGSGSALAMATSNNGKADGPLITAPWGGDQAREIYVEFNRALEDLEEDQPLYGRTAEMAVRLATIRALGIDPQRPVVTTEHMIWGRDLAMWSAQRMIAETSDYMAETEHQANAKLVFRIIREHPAGISHRELGRRLQKRFKGRDLKDLIDSLEEAGDIVLTRSTPPAGGPATITYTPARH
jgi:hypothetical protein